MCSSIPCSLCDMLAMSFVKTAVSGLRSVIRLTLGENGPWNDWGGPWLEQPSSISNAP